MEGLALILFLVLMLWVGSLALLFYVIRGAVIQAMRAVHSEQEASRQ